MFEPGRRYKFYGVDGNCFKLDDTVYEALEDECDGYRSRLQDVLVREPKGLIFFREPLAEVTIREKVEGDNEFQEAIDADGHVWLQWGTGNADNWYPYFVFDYCPKPGVVE